MTFPMIISQHNHFMYAVVSTCLLLRLATFKAYEEERHLIENHVFS